jgi:hypothetical protein
MNKAALKKLEQSALMNISIVRIMDQAHGSDSLNFAGTCSPEQMDSLLNNFAFQNKGIIEIFEGKTVVTTEKRIRTYYHVGTSVNS